MQKDSIPRSVEACPHRKPAPSASDADAVCDLLQRLIGTADRSLGKVSAAACRACCRHFCPTEQDLNPVVASLLYTLAESLLDRDDQAGCDVSSLRRTQRWAEDSLPILLPHEDDVGPTGGRENELPITVDDIADILPLPRSRHGSKVSNWAVGVTTAPRRQATLEQSLDSLGAAGWNDPHLFVDGTVEIPASYGHLQATIRNAIGAWPNYYLSLKQLLERHPQADALMMVQDDVLFPPSSAVREYVQQALWPTPDPSLVSLYCCSDYTAPRPGWSVWRETWRYGALVFVFSPELAAAFLTDEQVRKHGAGSGNQRKAGIDSVIGDWAFRRNLPVYRTTPSLVQHIGHISAIWDTSRAVGVRRASSYVGEHFR